MKTCKALLLAGLMAISPLSHANSSQGSELISQGSALIVSGSVATLASAASWTVELIEHVGESAIITLRSLPAASAISVQIANTSAGASALAIGESIQAVSHSSGTLLIRAGEILAIIPNEIGRGLLHQGQYR